MKQTNTAIVAGFIFLLIVAVFFMYRVKKYNSIQDEKIIKPQLGNAPQNQVIKTPENGWGTPNVQPSLNGDFKYNIGIENTKDRDYVSNESVANWFNSLGNVQKDIIQGILNNRTQNGNTYTFSDYLVKEGTWAWQHWAMSENSKEYMKYLFASEKYRWFKPVVIKEDVGKHNGTWNTNKIYYTITLRDAPKA